VLREASVPRAHWRARCEQLGFSYHSIDGTYWDESARYRFEAREIDILEAATEELHRLCLKACERVVALQRFEEFAIPRAFWPLITASWRAFADGGEATGDAWSLFGRFDLAWAGAGPPKLLEYNADTPTALLEASVVQWQWLREVAPTADQFNSIHEKLIARWRTLRTTAFAGETLYFACVRNSDEDLGNVEYLRDTAIQAGFDTRHIAVEDIGWDRSRNVFVDLEGQPLRALFKLYPWEWLARDRFGMHVPSTPTRFIEPPWKMILSNKAILAVLWEMFPGHPNLLPASRDAGRIRGDAVRKPLLSREGANVSLHGSRTMMSGGSYGAEGYVYQAYCPLYSAAGQYAVIGSWVVGDEAAGIGIREDASPITRNTSRFVPHYFS